MEQKYFVKQGLVQKAKGKILGGFDLNRFVKWLLKKINVPYADPCCLEDQENFPLRYNSGLDSIQRFDGEAGAWLNIDELGSEVSTNVITELTPGDGVTVEGVKFEDGGGSNPSGSQLIPFIPVAAAQNIVAGTGGAINVTSYYTSINTDAGGDAFTLAAATQIGQLKEIRLVADGGGDGVVTVTGGSGFTTLTFNDAADEITLMWTGTAWVILKNVGVTVA